MEHNPYLSGWHGFETDPVWPDDYQEGNPAFYHTLDGHNSSTTTIQRYLDEPDRTWFYTTTLSIDHATKQGHLANLVTVPSAHLGPAWPQHTSPSYPSPSLSGFTSSCLSSATSDRQMTPLSPIDSTEQLSHPGRLSYGFGGGYVPLHEHKRTDSFPCVALHEVQPYDDSVMDGFVEPDDELPFVPYASASHDDYQPLDTEREVTEINSPSEDAPGDDDYSPLSSNIKCRRSSTSRPLTSPRAPSKVTKRTSITKQASRKDTSACDAAKMTPASTAQRAFPCALAMYGCTSTFGSKNEWKRHVNTQHMRLGYWRCDQCDCGNRKHNDFNRKDLFIQHVRRMHPVGNAKPAKTSKSSTRVSRDKTDDAILAAIADRCFVRVRSPPEESGCHFCDLNFVGDPRECQSRWDERLEHLARHMGAKKGKTIAADPATWPSDPMLEAWLIHENLIIKVAVDDGSRYVLVDPK